MVGGETGKQENREKELRGAANKQLGIFTACVLIFGWGCIIISGEVLDHKSLIPVATAVGSGVVLVGSLGQAVDELSRAKRSWRFVYPVPISLELRLLNGLLTLNKVRRERAVHEISDLRKKIRDDHALMTHSERAKLIGGFGEAVRKARNWLIIVAGSICLLVAGIYGAVSG
jgi:hypothetical protein